MSGDEPDWSRPVWGPASMTSRLERRTLIENNGVVTLWINKAFDNRIGKFFPRGCRGWIDDVEVYCYDTGAAGGTITVYISPFIGCGVVQQANLVIPPGGAAAWRAAAFNLVWNYDALFIWAVCSTVALRIGYDTGTPYDSYDSANQGLDWVHQDRRMWARVIMKGETAGDVPVSGTLNTIPIPTRGTMAEAAGVEVNIATWQTLQDMLGAGKLCYLWFRVLPETNSHNVWVALFADDMTTPAWYAPLTTLNSDGFTPSTPGVSLTTWAENQLCVLWVTLPIEFRHRLRLAARKGGAGDPNQSVDYWVGVNVIR